MEMVEQRLKDRFIAAYRQMAQARDDVISGVNAAQVLDNLLVPPHGDPVAALRVYENYKLAHEDFVTAATDYARYLKLKAERIALGNDGLQALPPAVE